MSIAPLVSSETSKPGVAQAFEQLQAIGLRQGLAAGDADMLRAVSSRTLCQDGVEIEPVAGVKGILGVAILAAQRAAGQPHEHRGKADRSRPPPAANEKSH